MKKVFNILFYLVLTVAIVVIAGLSYHYYKMPQRLTPAPYKIAKGVYEADEIASNADVLIVGDNMGVSIGPHIDKLTMELSKKLARPLSIYNISQDDESLYRTIQKVESLEKVPKILIIATGYSEMQEDLYPKTLQAKKNNNLNFKIYRNLYVQSLMQLYPEISRLVFVPEHIKELKEKIVPIDFTKLTPQEFRDNLNKEISLYEVRLEKFLRRLKANGTNVLLVIPPINIELQDLKVCADTTNETIETTLKQLQNLLTKGQTKEAQIIDQTINNKIVANTFYHQLKQELYEKQGKITKAYEQALLKLSFACEVKSGHPIFIKTLENTALSQNIDSINFNEIVKQSYTRDPLFISAKTPQSIYFPKLMKELVIKLKQLTQLR